MLMSPASLSGGTPAPSLQPPATLLRAIEQSHNPSQLLAIRTALTGRGVTLVQGPPGTGKTKTILGILSVLLAAEARRRAADADDLAADALDAEGRPIMPGSFNASRPRPFETLEDSLPAGTELGASERGKLLLRGAPWLSTAEYKPGYGTPAAAAPAAVEPRARAPGQPAPLPPRPYPRACETDAQIGLGRSLEEQPPKRVLVCAPSNAAIDEIVSRLVGQAGRASGMLDAQGEPTVPQVVRVGPNVKEDLLSYALDTLAKKRQQEKGGVEAMNYEVAKMSVLNEAAIVCTTLSCAGYTMFSQLGQGFDTVLVDEAAQAVEVSTLIPLRYACRRLILVGDPSQLPATVFSSYCTEKKYEQSLFQRLMIGGQRVAMLTTQYRMHPDISRFPSSRFYQGAISNAPRLDETCAAPWHARKACAPYVFYDVADATAVEASTSSWSNEMEGQLALAIVRFLLKEYPERLLPASIGIVSPYNAQVRHIRKVFGEAFGAAIAGQIEVNSVDGFQGREKDIIILSCTRSDHHRDKHERRGVGFLRDSRRLNVSITRAKNSVFVLGTSPATLTSRLGEVCA